ncbi:MAG: hypothetical protein K2X93_19310 [Candidatus Obscuribacterales bacterium]|nr:hypothetical protein [Candidatus Obscuribacterales bacterium]
MVSTMNKTVRSLAIGGLRERYPEDSDVDLRIKLAKLFYGEEVACRIAKRFKNT